MNRILLLLSFGICVSALYAQTNMSVSNAEAEAILLGNYDPSGYVPAVPINHPDSVLLGIMNDVSSDTMISWLAHIDTHHNRNSGSDTLSASSGIGAVRRWIHSKLSAFGADNENRLIVSYLDWDRNICGAPHHRNVFGILPGLDTTNKEIVFLEAHYDTRCEGGCDTDCYSPGMDDNGSGTVLVMELARVMSRYAFNQTIIFSLNTAEDQGLYGAKAWAAYLSGNGIVLRACLNNDVVGGIACGSTSSPPSCPYLDHIDSLNVRVFSYSGGSDSSRISTHKQLARYLKMHQEELINPLQDTPLNLNLMIKEDRLGRGGDHQPLREKGYPSIRYTSQNEHGDGSGTPPDRQHSTRDVLGMDLSLPPDGIIDTFFVDPGYLRRNTISNGVNAGFLALAPTRPAPVFTPVPQGIHVDITGADTIYRHYRLAVRSQGSGTLYFDTIYTFTDVTSFEINGLPEDKEVYFSVMNVGNGFESLPCPEFTQIIVGMGHLPGFYEYNMLQNAPNPFTHQTSISIWADQDMTDAAGEVVIHDLSGREVSRIPVKLSAGKNSCSFTNTNGLRGVFTYSLIIEDGVIQTKKMVIL